MAFDDAHPPPRERKASGLRRSCVFLGRASAALVLFGLALFAVGRLLTDRFLWSQYLWWMPSLVAGLAAIGGLAISHAFAFAARSRSGQRNTTRARSGRRLRLLAWIGTLVLVLYALLVEWRPPGGSDRVPRAERFRIAYWNFSLQGDKGWERPVTAEEPDLFVTLAGSCTSRDGIREWLGDEHDHLAETWFLVASKAPILAYAPITLNIEPGEGIDPRESDFVRHGRDPGRGMVLLIDARERLGREIVAWLIDMPSDLSLWRDKASREAVAAMMQAPPRVWKLRADHRTRESIAPTAELLERFKHPDVILGDFNTPRGSASLRHISLGFANAFDQAGEGYCATFPRERALWHLDQMFVGRELRAVTYRVIDAPAGSHRPQLADLVRATPQEPPSAASSSAPASADRPGPSANDPARPPTGTNP